MEPANGESAVNPEHSGPKDLVGRFLLRKRAAPPNLWLLCSVSGAVLLVLGIASVGDQGLGLMFAVAATMVTAPFLAAVDWLEFRLPDVLTLPLAGVVILALAAQAAVHDGLPRLGWAALIGLGIVLFFGILFLIAPAALGFGDVKLMASLGVLLGWWGLGAALTGVLLGLVVGLIVAIVSSLWRGRRSHIALGPPLLIGALGTVLILL